MTTTDGGGFTEAARGGAEVAATFAGAAGGSERTTGAGRGGGAEGATAAALIGAACDDAGAVNAGIDVLSATAGAADADGAGVVAPKPARAWRSAAPNKIDGVIAAFPLFAVNVPSDGTKSEANAVSSAASSPISQEGLISAASCSRSDEPRMPRPQVGCADLGSEGSPKAIVHLSSLRSKRWFVCTRCTRSARTN